jgi:hypothetical protein
MKEQSVSDITGEEITVALGQRVLNQQAAAAFVNNVENTNENILCAFEKQAKAAAVSQFLMFRFIQQLTISARVLGINKNLRSSW